MRIKSPGAWSEESDVGRIARGGSVTALHIGAAGELLVQYRLLKLGIDSARLTTDSGIDLVVYSPANAAATTVQVKAAREPQASGGTGKLAVGWTFPHELRAEILAVAVLSLDEVWLFTLAEARAVAQQHRPGGSRRLYWYTDPTIVQRAGVPLKLTDMDDYLLDRRAPMLFPR
jgi:hypothetical protein